MAEHRSQSSPFDGLSHDLRRAFLTLDHLASVPLTVAWAEGCETDPDDGYWDVTAAQWRRWTGRPLTRRRRRTVSGSGSGRGPDRGP